MVNFIQFACALALMGTASSQSLAPSSSSEISTQVASVSSRAPSLLPSGVAAPTGGNTKSIIKVRTSVGPPVSAVRSETGTVTARATGVERRQASASSASARSNTSAPPKPSGGRPTGSPLSSAPSRVPTGAAANDISALKFSKLPPNFNPNKARAAPTA